MIKRNETTKNDKNMIKIDHKEPRTIWIKQDKGKSKLNPLEMDKIYTTKFNQISSKNNKGCANLTKFDQTLK